MNETMRIITISPSDLSYAWKDSPRGLWEKYIMKISRPRMPFPSIFNTIDLEMKKCFEGKNMNDVAPSLPHATIANADKWVSSVPIVFPKYNLGICFRGKVDSTIKLLNTENDEYGVIDFKATSLNKDIGELYKWQLHAYAYALEKNNEKDLHLTPINKLGLVAYDPGKFIVENGQAHLLGALEWVEIPIDKEGFMNFIKKSLLPILTMQEPPEATTKDDQDWMKYIMNFDFTDDSESDKIQEVTENA